MFSSNTSQVSSGGYEIQRSLRFNSADTAFLNRTPASASNRRTWTWSGWVKRSALAAEQAIFGRSNSAGSVHTGFIFQSNNTIQFFSDNSGGYAKLELVTTPVFRDPSAFYHLVFVLDTTQATAANRARIFVNGVQVTSFTTADYPNQNDEYQINTTNPHGIGRYFEFSGNYFFNGYMTEINFIDGQALTPSSFGAFDAQTGVWGPTRYAGSYGTNGFYLNFSDNSNTTAATLGRDYSGNSNNWTPNNFSVSAGAGNDSLVDVPTNWGTDTGVGGTVRGNYATMNPIDVSGTGGVGMVLSNGNLQLTGQASNWRTTKASIGMSSGKWYFETTVTSISGSPLYAQVGIATQVATTDNYLYVSAFGWAYINTGDRGNNNSVSAYGATWTTNDVIGVAFDADVGTLTFYKNGTSQGTAFSGLTSGPYFFAASMYDPSGMQVNFGQRPFAYTAPSGFRALNTQNLPTPTIGATTATQAGKFFNPVLWTANGGVQTITGAGLQPDFLWIKDRQAANSHTLHNIVVGSTKYLESNTTSAEITSANYVTSIDSDGWSIGTSNYLSGRQLVSWCWKANGAGVTNTAGTITSTVSANTTSGFSVVRWTQPGSGTYTIGHGLGAAPAMIIMKSSSNTGNWSVYHRSLGFTQYISLNLTGGSVVDSSVWVAAPTSSVFSQLVNYGTTGTSVAYCFAEVPGYSRFGSYVGNGNSDGPFVFCGFRPAWVLVRRADGADDWHLFDNKRIGYNVRNEPLYPNGSYAEGSGFNYIDLLSNGFKMRNTSYENLSGVTYIYAAFAEAPQKFALAR